MPQKKIAFFINSLAGSGAEKVVSLLVKQFCIEYEVHLILLTNLVEYEIPSERIKIFLLDHSAFQSKNRSGDILKSPFLAYKLKKYLQQNEIKTCISFLVRSNYINCLLRPLGWKGRIIISERAHTSSGYNTNSFSDKTAKFLIRYLYRYADLIVPNAYLIAKDLKEQFNLKNRFEIIYNPIDLELHAHEMMEPAADFSFDQFTFITVGRFGIQKNHDVLMRAVEKIKDRNFKLLLIGQGELEPVIRQQVEELKIADKVVFMGYKNNPSRYISRSQCFVLPSFWEGFPNALLEALADGTAVISTDCPSGPREMLYKNFDLNATCTGIEKADFGLLVPVNDADHLAKAMLMMMDNDALRKEYATKGKQRAKDFDLPVIMKQFERVFLES